MKYKKERIKQTSKPSKKVCWNRLLRYFKFKRTCFERTICFLGVKFCREIVHETSSVLMHTNYNNGAKNIS